MNSIQSPISVNPVSSVATKLISIIIILLVFAISAIALRITSVYRLGRKWKVHDFLCFLSLFCFLGYCIDIIVGIYHGSFGLPITEVEPSRLVIGFKTFFASQFFWSAGVASFRLAIVLLYIEIFQQRAFFWSGIFTGTIVVTYYMACVITILVECRPVSFNWNHSISGTCANTNAVAIFSAAFNMGLDIWVVCLPLPIVWDLNMARKRKLAVSATFALGLIIAGLNLSRLIVTLRCDSMNFTHCVLPEYMIVVGEMSVGILVACVPTMGPIFTPSRFQRKSSYQYKGRSGLLASKKTPPGLSVLTNSNDGSFHAIEDDSIELRQALHMGNGALVTRGSNKDTSDAEVIPNTIVVKQDLDVVRDAR